MRHLLVVFAVLLTASGAQAYSYATGGCATAGCAAGESWLFSNANELDTALDALEATDTTVAAIQFVTRNATSALSAEHNIGLLTTGLLLNTVSGAQGTLTAFGGTTPCSNQVMTALSAVGAATCTSLSTAFLPSGATLDADTTEVCVSKQFQSPEGGEVLSMYGTRHATTLTAYRAYVLPVTLAETASVIIGECTAGQQSCANSDTALTANSDTAAWDTVFSDALIDADDSIRAQINTVSDADALSAGSVTVELCYTRAVVAP